MCPMKFLRQKQNQNKANGHSPIETRWFELWKIETSSLPRKNCDSTPNIWKSKNVNNVILFSYATIKFNLVKKLFRVTQICSIDKVQEGRNIYFESKSVLVVYSLNFPQLQILNASLKPKIRIFKKLKFEHVRHITTHYVPLCDSVKKLKKS